MEHHEQNETFRIDILRDLTHLLNDFSDDTPAEMVHGTLQFKVQGTWFGSTLSNIETALSIFPNNGIEEEFQLFRQEYDKRNADFYKAKREGRTTEKVIRRTKEEVGRVNDLIKKVIEHLQNSI